VLPLTLVKRLLLQRQQRLSMSPAATTVAAALIAVRYQEGQDFAAIRRRHVHVGTTKTFPHHRRRNHKIILYASENNSAEDDDVETEVKTSLSPLAMAAADWLEEEEDELAMYWDRYDVAKKNSNSGKEQTLPSAPQPQQDQDNNDATTTTEERLDRYYQSRNIDRGIERQHSTQIKQAIEKSKKASSAEEAIQLLVPIRQYLQYNTKLGGNAYFELAQALDANGQVEEATDVYEKLALSPHVEIRRKSRELLAMGSSRRKRSYNRNVWNWLWDV
jgi:hypothetical protein